MIRRVLVLGGGSAGFLAAITLKHILPSVSITVLRSKDLGIIGVGEGTTVMFPIFIHGRLGMDPAEFHRIAQPTWKLGIRFRNWGPREFFDYTFRPAVTSRWQQLPKPNGYYCFDDFTAVDISSALMDQDKVFRRDEYGLFCLSTDAAYHIENQRFVEALERNATRRGILMRDDTVVDVLQDEHRVTGLRLASGHTEQADLFVDCSGFHAMLLGKALGEPFTSFKSTLFCDRAVVGGWDRTTEPVHPYTTAEAMDAGWCWRIDHEHRINRGYVYSSAFISDEDAEREFRSKCPAVATTRIVRFVSGRYNRLWVKNVVAIGNVAGFVEPMEATALTAICEASWSLAHMLAVCDGQPGASILDLYNKRMTRQWDQIRRFLAIHYRFNTRGQTPFWQACREKLDMAGAEPVVQFYQEHGPALLSTNDILGPEDQFGFEGYYSILLGQKVPYRQTHPVSETERDIWRRVQARNRGIAADAYSVPSALAYIRQPGFEWPRNLFDPRTAYAVT